MSSNRNMGASPQPQPQGQPHRRCQPRRQRQAPRWAGLLLVSAASTASAMSLSNFQVITSSAVPISCILAYNQPLQDCTMADFTKSSQGASSGNDNTCSAGCQQGILQTQQTLKTVCVDVGAPSGSVLETALTGDLISFLCGGDDTAAEPTATPPTSTIAVVVVTSSPASMPGFMPGGTTMGPPPTASSEPTPEPLSTQAGSSPSPQSVPTETTGAQQTKTPPAPQKPDTTRGGGSPFDTNVLGGGTGIRELRWSRGTVVLAPLAVALLLLLR